MQEAQVDVQLSVQEIQIECAYQDKPVNFSYDEKTNSQDLEPLQRVSWSITGWRRASFLKAARAGSCATYSGAVGYYPIEDLASHVIKTERDLAVAEALLPLIPQTSER